MKFTQGNTKIGCKKLEDLFASDKYSYFRHEINLTCKKQKTQKFPLNILCDYNNHTREC
ncbi:MAG: hypothetical protein P1U74_08325 [Legionellaceae bacterium]|nr:hypothetical protein [Legionellaceae bacterium]